MLRVATLLGVISYLFKSAETLNISLHCFASFTLFLVDKMTNGANSSTSFILKVAAVLKALANLQFSPRVSLTLILKLIKSNFSFLFEQTPH